MLAAQAALADARAAATAIQQRHMHDAGAEQLPGTMVPRAGDMAGLLDYLRSHPLRDRQRAADDARDALAILRYLYIWGESIELAMLRSGHDNGRSWLDLAKARGWRSKQAAQQRLRYLEGRRAAASGGDQADLANVHGAEAWLATHAAEIVLVSGQVAAIALVTEAADSAEVLVAELANRTPSPSTLMNWLAIVLDEMSSAGGLADLDTPTRELAGRLVTEWRKWQPREHD